MDNVHPGTPVKVIEKSEKSQNPSNFSQDVRFNQFYDSDWTYDHNDKHHKVVFRHGLQYTPRLVELYFSPTGDASDVYPIRWSWRDNSSGNPVTIKYTTETIVLNIATGVPLHGTWDAEANQWLIYNKGYWRAIAWL